MHMQPTNNAHQTPVGSSQKFLSILGKLDHPSAHYIYQINNVSSHQEGASYCITKVALKSVLKAGLTSLNNCAQQVCHLKSQIFYDYFRTKYLCTSVL